MIKLTELQSPILPEGSPIQQHYGLEIECYSIMMIQLMKNK